MQGFFKQVKEYWDVLGQPIYKGKRLERNLKVNSWIGHVVAIIGAVMTIMNIIQHKGIVTFITGLISLAGIVIIVSIKRFKNGKVATFCALFISVFLFSWMAISGFNDGFAILWTMIVPLAFCYFQSVKYGIMFSLYYEVLFIILFYTPLRATMSAHYSETFMNRYPILYLCSILVNCTAMIQYHSTMLMQIEYEEKQRVAEETALAAGSSKSRFLAQVSHEIRTPINAMLGMNEMIIRESKDDHILDYAGNIQSAGVTLLGLVNSILDFSKIEDGKMEILPVDYDVAALINNLVNSIIYRAHEKGLAFNVNVDHSIPAGLYGDDMRISQVIMNLLTNAVKYTEKGEVTLTITCQSKNDEEAEIFVSVKDTGIGIATENIEGLFEDFKRFDLQRNRKIEGTGLGMPIVTNLLDMMGSRLEVESEYGVGSTFSFVLRQRITDPHPIGDYEQRLANINIKRKTNSMFRAPKARVMVVDDNDMNLKVAAGFLKLCGISPVTVCSGDEAIDLMKENTFDIVFLDHMMPKKDGIQTLKELFEKDLIPKETTMIALTANAVVGAKESYLACGFNDYLSKPINMDMLVETLKTYLPDDRYSFVESDAVGEDNTAKDKEDAAEKKEYSGDSETDRANDTADPCTDQGEENTDIPVLPGYDMSKLSEIGLNMKEGLENCADDPELYAEMIEEYAGEFEKKKAHVTELYENEDWENYQIQVHAIKSTSRTIGLMELSALFKELEFAAKDKDIDLIREKTAPALEIYTGMVEKLEAAKQ